MSVILSKDANGLEMTKIAQLFKSGLESLNAAVTSVVSTKSRKIETIAPYVTEFKKKIEDAAKEAKLAENLSSSRLSHSLEQKSAIENRIRKKQWEKKELEINLSVQKSKLSDLQSDLQYAQRNVRESKRAFHDAKKQLEDKELQQKAVLTAGVGLSAIPLTGWVTGAALVAVGIAGPTLIGVSLTALKQNVKAAEEYLDEAKQHLNEKESLVRKAKTSVSFQENKIANLSTELDNCEREKQKNEEDVQNVEMEFRERSTICRKLEEAVTYIETTVGRSSIVCHEIDFFYDWEQLFVPLKSLASHLSPELSLEASTFRNFQLCLKALEEVSENENKKLQLMPKEVKATDIDDPREYFSCEHLLVPAPMALNLLGQVCTLSLKRDFSLKDSMPESGFTFLTRNSFRANLQDITHLVWFAFHTAQVNMDQMHILTKTLPIHLSKALDMVKHKTDISFKDRSGKCLNAISSTATRCKLLSKEAEDEFTKIINTLKELEVACISAMGKQEQQLKENKIFTEQNQKIKENVDENRRLHMEKLEELKEETGKTKKEYQNSIQLPGLLETTVIGIADLPGYLRKKVLSEPSTKNENDENLKGRRKPKRSQEEVRSYEIAKILLAEMKTLNKLYVRDGSFDRLVLEKCAKMTAIEEKIRHEETRLQEMAENPVQKDLLKICEEAIAICKFLQKFKYNMTNDGQMVEHARKIKEMKSLEVRLHNIREESVNDVATESHNILEVDEVTCIGEAESTKSGNIMSHTIHKKKMKSKAHLKKLENLQDQYYKEASDLTESSEQLAKVLSKMASLKMEKIDFEETLNAFRESLKSLAEIRNEWRKLMEFFQNVVNIIDSLLNDSVQEFREYAELELQGFSFGMMYDEALQVKEVLAGLSHISETYIQISKKFLLPIAKDLQGILGETKNDSSIEFDLQFYKTKCSTVKDEIENLIRKEQAMNPSCSYSEDEIDEFC